MTDQLTMLATVVTGLSVLVGFIGVAFLFVAYWEFSRIRQLRDDFKKFQTEQEVRLYNSEKAQQRVFASYAVNDISEKIALLKSAAEIDPKSFNVFNALGYAYLESKDYQAALNAFSEAIEKHPKDKAGYFDLARAYIRIERSDLAFSKLKRAVFIDASAKNDILNDSFFHDIHDKFR